MHLAIEIRIDCNLQESECWPQAVLLWMPYRSCGSDQLTNEILQRTLCLLCLSPLSSQTCTWWALCTEQQAAVYISGQVHTPLTKSKCPLLPADCMRIAQAFATMCLLSQRAPQYSSFPSELKSLCYFVGWLSLQREGCVASIAQPPLGLLILRDS